MNLHQIFDSLACYSDRFVIILHCEFECHWTFFLSFVVGLSHWRRRRVRRVWIIQINRHFVDSLWKFRYFWHIFNFSLDQFTESNQLKVNSIFEILVKRKVMFDTYIQDPRFSLTYSTLVIIVFTLPLNFWSISLICASLYIWEKKCVKLIIIKNIHFHTQKLTLAN